MRTIAISSKDIQPNTNNSTFHYTFPSNVIFKNQEIALSSLTFFSSIYNISESLNNHKVQYTWDGVTYTITFENGIYEITDINARILFEMKSNNHYLIDKDFQEVYFLEMLLNTNRYGVNVISYEVPTAYSTTYPSQNNTHFTLPSSGFNPQLKMVSNNDFYKLIGYPSNFVSSATATSSITYLSTTSPILNPNANMVVSLSCVNNPYSSPFNIIYAFGLTASAGEIQVERPNEPAYNEILNGSYNFIDLKLLNADTLRPIELVDPEVSIMLIVKDKKDSN